MFSIRLLTVSFFLFTHHESQSTTNNATKKQTKQRHERKLPIGKKRTMTSQQHRLSSSSFVRWLFLVALFLFFLSIDSDNYNSSRYPSYCQAFPIYVSHPRRRLSGISSLQPPVVVPPSVVSLHMMNARQGVDDQHRRHHSKNRMRRSYAQKGDANNNDIKEPSSNTLGDAATIRAMRVKELKAELTKRNIKSDDAFEKEELVQRLLGDMKNNSVNMDDNNNIDNRSNKKKKKKSRTEVEEEPHIYSSDVSPLSPSSSETTATKKKKKRRSFSSSTTYDDNVVETDPNASTPLPPTAVTKEEDQRPSLSSDVVYGPLYFTGLGTDLKVAAVNMGGDGGGITVNPGDQPYPTIQISVQNKQSSSPSFQLRLLLDTACSGFVLRPSVVDKHGLVKLKTPVTMTGAGGTAGAAGLTQIDSFEFGGQSFGPLPAAVQDIGALPASLDGIIGLSFLAQFPCVDMDFATGVVSLHKKMPPILTSITTNSKIVARGTMDTVSQLGIYTANVYLGSRGPVKMIVDTGAASSFLNWKGVESLELSRDNPALKPLQNAMGAMGSDNIAMRLTHRIHVSSSMRLMGGSSGLFGRRSASSESEVETAGLSLNGSKRLQIDIGEIAILDSLRGQGVGGILGIDALMHCSCVRMTFQGPLKEIILFEQEAS